MATASKIKLSVAERPAFFLQGMNEDGASKASELLQRNHEDHHIFFNNQGFHNHIAHHIPTIYALGADSASLNRHYEQNATYQRSPVPVHRKEVEAMSDPDNFIKFLGDENYYHDYLVFFQQEIERNGCKQVLKEYIFKGDSRANNLLVRLFAGFLHPIIHLGFGLEFRQPAIIAEALAQACVHEDWIGNLFLPTEEADKATKKSATLMHLLREIHNDKDISTAAHLDDGNKIRDGVLARASAPMIKVASQYTVTASDDLARKTAEMISAAALFSGAAQHPPKQVKFDFFFIHSINASIFFSSFDEAQHPWLDDADARRLLEWKGRADLVMYASRGAPALRIDEIKDYVPKDPDGDVFERVVRVEDDGHAAKLVRALGNGRKVCERYEGMEGFEVTRDMWDKLLHMAIDSVEGSGERWVRNAGFEEAWKNFDDRERAVL